MLALMSWDFYEVIMETLGDAELMAALRQSIREAAAGKVIPWAAAKAQLDR